MQLRVLIKQMNAKEKQGTRAYSPHTALVRRVHFITNKLKPQIFIVFLK